MPHRESLIAEVWVQNQHFCDGYVENSQQKIEIFTNPDTNLNSWDIDLHELKKIFMELAVILETF